MASSRDDSSLSLRRRGRPKKQHDYKLLSSGPTLPNDKVTIKSWSTTKLFPLVIVDSKKVDETHLVKVHYTEDEWSSPSYDEWRDARDVIDVPKNHTVTEDDIDEMIFMMR